MGVNCSKCGALIPRGRLECDTCGTRALSSSEPNRSGFDLLGRGIEGGPLVASHLTCRRCAYTGDSIPYFTRGPHMAALVGATLFTLPYAMGAGGAVYYFLRKDHRVCPRCGNDWGKAHLLAPQPAPGQAPGSYHRVTSRQQGEVTSDGVQGAWSIIFFILSAIMLAIGAVEFELLLFVFGVLAAAGAVTLHLAANRAREVRRQSLMAALQTPVLKLAAERHGVLTVTDVAAGLGWPIKRAEKVLQSLDDGWRVNSEVTDEGVIVYEFRELLLGPGRSFGEESL